MMTGGRELEKSHEVLHVNILYIPKHIPLYKKNISEDSREGMGLPKLNRFPAVLVMGEKLPVTAG